MEGPAKACSTADLSPASAMAEIAAAETQATENKGKKSSDLKEMHGAKGKTVATEAILKKLKANGSCLYLRGTRGHREYVSIELQSMACLPIFNSMHVEMRWKLVAIIGRTSLLEYNRV